MTHFKLSRRAALAGLGAIALATPSPRPATGSAASEQALLIPHGPLWANPDFMTIGIGLTGHLLVSGGIPNLWLGQVFLATASVEPWRVPGAARPGDVFRVSGSPRGRPLTLVVGDLADPRWLKVAREVMAEARNAGRFVVGVNACLKANGLPIEALVDRLGAVCDCFILDPDLPDWITKDMDTHDQAILALSGIDTIAVIAARYGGEALAARMPAGIYQALSQRMTWRPGRSPLPTDLKSTSLSPTLLAWHLPHFLPRRLARAFRHARHTLRPRPAGLMAVACCDEAYRCGTNIDMIAGWLTRLA